MWRNILLVNHWPSTPVYRLNLATLPDGALPAPWSAATTTIASGVLTITPTGGPNLLVNGNMETGDPPSSWTANAGAILDGVADERTGGIGVQSLEATRGTNDHAAFQSTPSGQQPGFYGGSAWVKNIDAIEVHIFTTSTASIISASTSWTKLYTAWRQGAAASLLTRNYVTGAAGQKGRFDDWSLQKWGDLACMAIYEYSLSNFSMIAPAISTFVSSTIAGIALCVADANNYVLAYQDGQGNVVIVERVAGAFNQLASVALAYGATKYFSAKKTGNQLSVYYGTTDYGTLVGGAAVTLNAALVNNKKVGIFSTCEADKFSGNFYMGPWG